MWRVTLLVVLALAMSMPAQAKEHKENNRKTHRKTAETEAMIRELKFSPAERNLIRAQLYEQSRIRSQQEHKSLPPGLQKKVARGKSLPPGWQKKITPGHSLDYHVYLQGSSLPERVLLRLPPAPIGSEIVQVQNKIIRLNSATRTILDVFDLAPAQE